MMLYRDFLEAGYPVFGLNGLTKDRLCTCGNPKCTAFYKHPLVKNWQHTPLFSDEQLEAGEMAGQFDTGYGILINGLIVVDIDERNGGVESYERLINDIPEIASCEFVVKTGSGGNSKHMFFKAPSGVSLSQHVSKYKGIDFKSSGFVVGAGSMHISGNRYEVLYGTPYDISDAPDGLIELLKHTDKHRSIVGGETIDITDAEIIDMLGYIDPDCEHEQWIRVGMAIHHSTNGAGFDLWNDWSAKGTKYPSYDVLSNRWHSFGKSANLVSLGTLIHYAESNGFSKSVEFDSNIEWENEEEISTVQVDLLRPPSLVGRIAKWINDASLYPREHLAVASALMAVSLCGGMRYYFEVDGKRTISNMFAFGIAGSGTGKDDIFNNTGEILRQVGVSSCMHGGIKSEQEIVRNLLDHQAAFYIIDEMGEVLAKIAGAREKSGSSPYLEGVIKEFMDIYSKSNSFKLINGDVKKKQKQDLQAELKGLQKLKEDNEITAHQLDRLNKLPEAIKSADNGIEKPFLHVFGLSTPEKFSQVMTQDMAVSGFMGRAFLAIEANNVPDKKKVKKDMDEFNKICLTLSELYGSAGYSENPYRVEKLSDSVEIPITKEALKIMDDAYNYFHEWAKAEEENKGLTAIPLRGSELVAKISLTLAIPEGVCTEEHAIWAFEFVKNDIKRKINMVRTNDKIDKSDALIAKIQSIVSKDFGLTDGMVNAKLRAYKKEDIAKGLELLIQHNYIKKEEYTNEKGRKVIKYFEC